MRRFGVQPGPFTKHGVRSAQATVAGLNRPPGTCAPRRGRGSRVWVRAAVAGTSETRCVLDQRVAAQGRDLLRTLSQCMCMYDVEMYYVVGYPIVDGREGLP